MTDKADDARTAAVRAYSERQAAEARAKAEREAAEREKAEALERNKLRWATKAFHSIYLGVMASNDAFSAKPGYDYAIQQMPGLSVNGTVAYEIRRSGSLNAVAALTFAMGDDGAVRPNTSARGCDPFPPPMPVADVTPAWATEVTDVVLMAVLRGQTIPIPGNASSRRRR